jgi:hypothetical protein
MLGFVGVIALVLYLVVKHAHRRGGGADLWAGLGFPYGPTGNLTGFGITHVMPVTTSTSGQFLLAASNGAVLTDAAGNPLLDEGSMGGFNAFGPGQNNSQLKLTYNFGGSRPS